MDLNLKEKAKNLLNQLISLIQETKPLNNLKTFTIEQVSEILQLAIAKLIILIQNTCTDLAGKDKKDLAMQTISDFYDQVFTIVELPFVPKILQPIFQRFIKQILLLVVSGAINGLVATFKDKNVM